MKIFIMYIVVFNFATTTTPNRLGVDALAFKDKTECEAHLKQVLKVEKKKYDRVIGECSKKELK